MHRIVEDDVTLCANTSYRGKRSQVYYDSKAKEYIVVFVNGEVYLENCDYITKNRVDALHKMRSFVSQ